MSVSMAISVQMDTVKIWRGLSDVFVAKVSNSLQQRITVKVGKNMIKIHKVAFTF